MRSGVEWKNEDWKTQKIVMRGRSQRWNICTIEAACNVSEMRGRRKGKFEVEDEDEMGGEERK